MTDNITSFQSIQGGKDERKPQPPSSYIVYHWGQNQEDVILSEYTGYSMGTETLFYVVDKDLNLLFMVPMSRVVYIEVTPGEYLPDANEIN